MTIKEAMEASTLLADTSSLGLRNALKEAGWTNPDGYGMFYEHPSIKASDGEPIIFRGNDAVSIQLSREAEADDSA